MYFLAQVVFCALSVVENSFAVDSSKIMRFFVHFYVKSLSQYSMKTEKEFHSNLEAWIDEVIETKQQIVLLIKKNATNKRTEISFKSSTFFLLTQTSEIYKSMIVYHYHVKGLSRLHVCRLK